MYSRVLAVAVGIFLLTPMGHANKLTQFSKVVGGYYYRALNKLGARKTESHARYEATRSVSKQALTSAAVLTVKPTALPPSSINSVLGPYRRNCRTYREKDAVGKVFDVGNNTLLRLDAAVSYGRKNGQVMLVGTLASSLPKERMTLEPVRGFRLGANLATLTRQNKGRKGWGTGHANRPVSARAPASYVSFEAAERVMFEVLVKPGKSTVTLGSINGQLIDATVKVGRDGRVQLKKVNTELTEAGLYM